VVHCILSCDKVYQKQSRRDLGAFSLNKYFLGPQTLTKAFRKHLCSAVKVDAIHDLNQSTSLQCFVIQSEVQLSIYLRERNDVENFASVTAKGSM